jgi:glycosyltransferase involved in cell wall biosynthesis
MKIAIVAPPWIKIPPVRYGGIEAVISLLADGLAERGHDVILFTVKGSVSSASVHHFFEHEQCHLLAGQTSIFLNAAITHSLGSYIEIAEQGDFDIVHDNTWKEGLASAFFIDIPAVHTLHSPLDESNKKFYELFIGKKNLYFTTISEFQQTVLPGLNYAGTVYNSIEIESYPYSEEKEDYLLYLSRFNHEKAPHIACEAAKRLGMKLVLAGKVSEPDEHEYFDTMIKPYLNDKIRYAGEVSDEEKKRLFAGATAFVYPLQWDEPFGIVMIEAMACGTPVVTYKRGAAPELVENGVNGYLADDFEDLLDCIGRVQEIKPKRCREYVEKHFSVDAMVDGYERVYRQIMKG